MDKSLDSTSRIVRAPARENRRMSAVTTLAVTESLADALRRTWGNARASAKQVARAADSNTRAAENWLAARNAPTAKHLIHLMAESDAVFNAVLQLSGRLSEAEKYELSGKLEEIERVLKR